MQFSSQIANEIAVNDNIVPLPTPTTLQPTPKRAKRQTASQTASGKPVAYFQYRGRKWRIFKRRAHTAEELAQRLAGPAWTLYFEHEGKRNLWSLKFGDQVEAVREAKAKIDAYYDHRHDTIAKALAPRQVTGTFAQIFAGINKLAIDASVDSRGGYVWGTRYMLRLAAGVAPDVSVDHLSVSLLNGEYGLKMFDEARRRIATAASQAAGNKIRVTVASAWCNMHSLFSDCAVRSMERELQIYCPSTLPEFLRAKKTAKFRNAGQKQFAAPDAALLRRTFRQWLRIGRTPGYVLAGKTLTENERRNMFIAAGLAFSCGLRKGENCQIRGRHIVQDVAGIPRLSARDDVKVKNKSAEIHVRPLDPFWRLLWRVIRDNGWTVKPDEFLLTSRPDEDFETDRTIVPFELVSSWLRGLGWKLTKTNHALRDCAASFVTMKFGLTRAKLFCRHSSVKTTESHYGRFVNDDTMDNANSLKWLQWAK